MGVSVCPLPLLWLVVFTIACTNARAVTTAATSVCVCVCACACCCIRMLVCIARYMKGWTGVISQHLVLSLQIVVQTKLHSVKQLLKAQVCTWSSKKVNDSVSSTAAAGFISLFTGSQAGWFLCNVLSSHFLSSWHFLF